MAILRLPNFHPFEVESEIEFERGMEANKCVECEINYDELLNGNDTERIRSRHDSSSFSSDAGSTTSEDSGYTSLEMHHFHKALNQGVFNEVHASNRKERKKSFRGFRKSNEDVSEKNKKSFPKNSKAVTCRSSSFELSRDYRCRKRSKDVKIKDTLSNSGINLHQVDEKLSLDEIHAIQQDLFTNVPKEESSPANLMKPKFIFNESTTESNDLPLWNANIFTRSRSATFM